MRQVSIGQPLRIGAMAGAIVLLANVAVSLAIDSNNLARWLIVPAVGFGAAAIAVAMASPPQAELSVVEQAIAGAAAKRWTERGPRLKPMPIAGALAVALVVIGGGGVVVSGIARYGMAWVTGNERGPDRLVSPVSTETRGLNVTVTRIEQTAHFTRVTVTVRNESTAGLTMPIDGGNCMLIAGDGTAHQAESFRSQWNESVSRGSVRTGVVVFGGHLPAKATRARITFAHLFGGTTESPQSIVVANLQLLPG